MTSMKPFFVYVLRCSDNSYYIGHTDDLERRIQSHMDATFGGYTSTKRPVFLVFSCEFTTRDEAIERERQLKGWSRAKKEALILNDWETIKKLARSQSRPSTNSEHAERSAPFDKLRANGLRSARSRSIRTNGT